MKKQWLVPSILVFSSILGIGLVWWFLGGREAFLLRGLTGEQKTTLLSAFREGLRENASILFYGQVVDQDGVGIPNIKVQGEVHAFDEQILWHIRTAKSDEITKVVEVSTDREGRFSIENERGRYMNIHIPTAPGYEILVPVPNSFDYAPSLHSNFYPDKRKPIVCQAWRKGETEPTVQSETGFGIIPDGRTYTIDLLKRKLYENSTAEGDFRVIVQRTPRTEALNFREKMEWSMVLTPVEGGIQETNDLFLFRAPETGYQPKYEIHMMPTDPHWADHVTKQFYLRSRGGKVHASMTIEAYGDFIEKMGLSVKYLANPAGSRNLTPDRDKKINKYW